MMIRLKEDNVHQASPGDMIILQGVYLPHRRPGIHFEKELVFDGHIMISSAHKSKKKYLDMTVSDHMNERIDNVRANHSDDKLFEMMAQSIAPEIFGLEFVKKSLLLLLAGGVTVETNDHMRIRG